MKFLVIVFGLATYVAGAREVKLIDGITPTVFPPVEIKEGEMLKWEDLKTIALEYGKEVEAGHIEVDVTEYALKIMKNLDNLIVQLGLDPMQMSDQTLKLFPVGKLDLSGGWLTDLSTINVSDSVILRYTSETDDLVLTLPLSFQSILITYDYHVKIVLLGIKGSIAAEIKQVRCNLRLGFNMKTHHAFVHKVDITDSGHLSFKFTGLGLLNWVIDLLTGVLTTFCHKIILGVFNIILYVPVHDIVNKINSVVDDIFHRDANSLF